MQDDTLQFSDDPGARRSAWAALALVVLIVAWFASALLGPAQPEQPPSRAGADAPVNVAVITSKAESVTESFVAEGQALPDRDTMVRAETSGAISEVVVEKGESVKARAVIARFDPRERSADLRRAKAEFDRAQRDLANAETLLDRGTATLDRVARARADFAAAEAALAAARQAMDDTEIRAPFSGQLEELRIDSGEYVTAGTEVARVVDADPLTVTARVPQQSLDRLRPGQTAQIRFITGQTRTGTVSFVGSAADPETRTFEIEVEVDNPDAELPAGISAEMRIPTGEVTAHFVSPAILSLDEAGTLGLKTVGEDGRVAFHPVDVVRAETDGVWLTGLPETARIITRGQGFVRAGDAVDAHPAREGPAQ